MPRNPIFLPVLAFLGASALDRLCSPTSTASNAIHSIADMKRSLLISLSFPLLSASACLAADLALTPPMGWNSSNKFADKIDDQTVREIAHAMVSSGLKDAGYVYINIDDTWQGQRDAQGVMHPNDRFPDMKALADYVHGKGLKLGIYSSPGHKTCAGFDGSIGHEEQDAQTYA